MTLFQLTTVVVMGLSVCGGVLLPGCNSKITSEADTASAQFRLLGRMYGEYLAIHRGIAPPDEKSFTKFLQSHNDRLAQADISQVGELLVSPRDGQPLTVLYGKQSIAEGPGGLPWAAFEQTGLAGKRCAIGARVTVEEMEQERFDQVFSGRNLP
ncbi:MAG: hypothetical protein ABGX16_04785 [Pirellulales bacterium]